MNYTLPGKPLKRHEFKQMVKEAEEGRFHSIKFVREQIEKWKMKYPK